MRAGFERRWWEEISGAAQGELRGGGRGGVIQLWGVGSPEGNSKGQKKGNYLQARLLPVVKQYHRERLMSKNTDIDYSLLNKQTNNKFKGLKSADVMGKLSNVLHME